VTRLLPSFVATLLLAGCLKDYVFARLPGPVLGALDTPAGLPTISADTCAACHPDFVEEWRGSKMGQAWTDPIFQADFVRQGEPWVCRNCHTPIENQRPELIHGISSLKPLRGEGEPNPAYDASLRDEGVTCAACHLRDGAIEGPFADAEPPHAFRAVAGYGSADLCAPCHQTDGPPFSSLKRPIADVVGEWERWKAATGRTDSCIDCHMAPITRGLTAWTEDRPTRSHRFPGAWDADFVAAAIRVDEVTRTDAAITVSLTNLAGHNLPSDDPLRALIVRATLDTPAGPVASEVVIERVVEEPSYRERTDTTLRVAERRTISLPFSPKQFAGLPAARVELIWSPLHNAHPAVAVPSEHERVLTSLAVP
jgi:hypothetical protein